MPAALTTDRLLLRIARPDDAVVYHRLWTERDPRVPPHRRIGTDGHPTVRDIADHLSDEPGLLAVERRDTAEVIGYCGVVFHGNGAADEPEIAFELLRAVHGHGYATEAARAVVGRMAAAGHLRLWATVRDWNAASRRVLAKLGFRETGEVDRDALHGDSLLTVLNLRAVCE